MMAARRRRWSPTVGSWSVAAWSLAGMFGLLGADPAAASPFEWTDESADSVLIESGDRALDDSFAPGSAPVTIHDDLVAGPGPDPAAADASVAFAGDEFCPECDGAGCRRCRWWAWAAGLGHGRCHDACWIGRADALILWRDAPPNRPLVAGGANAATLLNATDLQSTLAAGPRVSILRMNNCTGNGLEATYLWVGNFQSTRDLAPQANPYSLSPPGIYGNANTTFTTGTASLTARLQGFELNRHVALRRNLRFLWGFRWLEWEERFLLRNEAVGGFSDVFQTNCLNDMYGGQIGLDALLSSTRWCRIESVVKAGAYYNNAVQTSAYTTTNPANAGTAAITVGQSPLNCTFVGEVGVTGVVPITPCLDVRFGYFGLWLSGLAQPTQQLSDQRLTPGQPATGAINASGGVMLQGATLGLEGRW